MELEEVLRFAKENTGFDAVSKLGTWKGAVYYDLFWENEPDGEINIGLPSYVAEKNGALEVVMDMDLKITQHFFPETE